MFTLLLLGMVFAVIIVGYIIYNIYVFCALAIGYYKDVKKEKEENKKKEQYYEDIRNGKIYIINR